MLLRWFLIFKRPEVYATILNHHFNKQIPPKKIYLCALKSDLCSRGKIFFACQQKIFCHITKKTITWQKNIRKIFNNVAYNML